AYLGIKNVVMVVYCNQPQPPFIDYARQFAGMDKVVWSIIGDKGTKRNNTESDLEFVLDLKPMLPNLQGGIMDDFFDSDREGQLANIKFFADQLHAAGLKLWVVVYGAQLEAPGIEAHLALCDVLSFWTWDPEELLLLDNRLNKLKKMVPDKQIALGCYMWDFHREKPISLHHMEYQCNLALKKYAENEISEIIMLGSPLIGMDIEAVNWTRQWLKSLQQPTVKSKAGF
ncbi:MAG: hypothetical protein PHV59_10245, partial [Victivallales bacterium]|nr:hypothetical protein [Victivallales bacterium]